jgi:hypothetical protein
MLLPLRGDERLRLARVIPPGEACILAASRGLTLLAAQTILQQ